MGGLAAIVKELEVSFALLLGLLRTLLLHLLQVVLALKANRGHKALDLRGDRPALRSLAANNVLANIILLGEVL